MKILHAHLSREFAGSERYCASLASGQAEAGHEVMVVVRHSAVAERWRREAAPARVMVLPSWLPSFLEGFALRNLIGGFAPDVVHTHLGRANVKVGRIARALKLPWVVTLHLRWKLAEMEGADALVCIARWQKQDIPHDFLGVQAVIWNWHEDKEQGTGNKAQGEMARNALRAGIGIGEKGYLFGSVGRLHGQKGMDVLVRAFKQAFGGDEDVTLLVAGEGAQRAELMRIVDGDPRIVLTGYVPDVLPYYTAFDGYVSAARYEPFGLTILEAMAAGCRLVCTRTEGPSEFLQGYDVTWADKGDVASLAAALKQAYRAGRKRVAYDMKPFDRKRALREMEAVYRRIRNEVAR